MTIRKAKGMEANFSIVPNKTINDDLSWAAKGLLVYLCSKPDDWEVSVAQLVKHSMGSERPTKRDATYTIINELITKGYVVRNQENKSGRFGKAEYIVSNTPHTDLPDTDEPHTDLPDTVKPTQQSKVLNKEQKELSVNDQNEDFAFDFFWDTWPTKKGKKAAKQKFEAVFKKLCKEHGIKPTADNKYQWANKLSIDTQNRLANGQYGFDKMHATTYLNGERWTDDHETNNQRNAPTGRKLSAVEENNARLLAKYGNPTASSERTINPTECAGMDSHEVSGSLQQQVASHGVTLDMDSGDLGDDSEGNPKLGF